MFILDVYHKRSKLLYIQVIITDASGNVPTHQSSYKWYIYMHVWYQRYKKPTFK